MATAKPKVKRMMFGGAAKGVAASMQGSAKQAAASKTAPKQMQFMSDKLRGAPMQSAGKALGSAGKPSATPPAGLNVAGIRKASAGLGDTFPRKSAPPPAFPAKSKPQQVPSQLASLAKAYNDQKSGKMGIGSQAAPKQFMSDALRKGTMAPTKTGLGDAMRGLGAVNNVARGIAGSDLKRAGLMKKGGAVKKKATKK